MQTCCPDHIWPLRACIDGTALPQLPRYLSRCTPLLADKITNQTKHGLAYPFNPGNEGRTSAVGVCALNAAPTDMTYVLTQLIRHTTAGVGRVEANGKGASNFKACDADAVSASSPFELTAQLP